MRGKLTRKGESMHIGILGDIHGDFTAVENIMKKNQDIKHWLCTGDIADEKGNYFSPLSQLYFISGNHENWEAVGMMDAGILKLQNLFHVSNASVVEIGKIKVLGLGGNYSPKYYAYKKIDLPDGRERHYTKCEVERCMGYRDSDILITHEAPSPYLRGEKDIGRLEITEVLKICKPKVHFFGHHHRFGVYELIKGIKSACLDRPSTSWVRLSLYDYSFERFLTKS